MSRIGKMLFAGIISILIFFILILLLKLALWLLPIVLLVAIFAIVYMTLGFSDLKNMFSKASHKTSRKSKKTHKTEAAGDIPEAKIVKK